jgi:hypothetical protein
MYGLLIRFRWYSKKFNKAVKSFYRRRADELSYNDVNWFTVSAS